MKFLCVYKPAKPEGTPPNQKEMEEMGKLIEEGMKKGWLLATEGCLPTRLGARVRKSRNDPLLRRRVPQSSNRDAAARS